MIAQFEVERAKKSGKQAPKEESGDDDENGVQPESRATTRSAAGNQISKAPKGKNNNTNLSKKDRKKLAGVV